MESSVDCGEIESMVDDMLRPYEPDLTAFRLEEIREQYRIWLIGTSRRVPYQGDALVFPVQDDYIIALHPEFQ